MDNQNENIEADEIVTPADVAEGEEDTTDYKALALKNAGIAQRYKTKFEKTKDKSPEAPASPTAPPVVEKKGLDYGEMAYLEAKGISDEDYPIVLEAMKSTGKSLRDVVNNKFVQAEIKDAKEARTSKEAIPQGSSRAASSNRNEVDYWIAKGELPPNTPENRELRYKVLNAKIASSKKASPFD